MKAKPQRVTVYVDPDLHTALRLKAAETQWPYSALVNEALRQSLAEDAGDLAAIEARAKERACRLRSSSRISSGVESYSVHLKRSAAKEIEAPSRNDRARIVERVRALSEDPRPADSKKVSGRDAHRIRQGDHRIVYTVDDEDRVVMISMVAHRRDADR
jgi:mRNA interferase RelE/StbE